MERRSHGGAGMSPSDPILDPTSAAPMPGLAFDLREHDLRGEPVALDAEPAPVRVTLTTDAGVLAVTVAPLPGDPRRVGHLALLRDLEAPAAAPGLPLLTYLALQRARIWRRALVVADEPLLVAGPMDMSLEAGHGLRASPLDRAMHRLFAACDRVARGRIIGRLVAEALATLDRRARAFADNAWCRAVREHRLSRAQYIAALANTHQYVRFTPRLLARAIAVTEDEALREHFYRHLQGEQRHDRLLEADLRYLGADVDFVVRAMVPAPATQAFMVVQESMIGFHRDPLRFLAAPFVAEGLAAHIEPAFLASLAANIRRWGCPEPALATRFLVSHAHVDGGPDGHFARTAAVLSTLLRDDTAQQRFLAVLHLAADAFTGSYDAYAHDFDLSL